MKREDLYNSFDSIVPDNEQRSRMLNEILDKKENLNNMKYKRPKFIIIAATICLMTTTVIATNIPAFQNLLDKISPDIVEFIEPIEEVCIDQGIKMEVVAVGRYDNTVKAYITFQDLEGDRIGEDLSFIDYYDMSGSDTCGWHLVDYDKNEKKATILVEAESNTTADIENNIDLMGENLTFKVSNIFYDHKEYKDREIGIDLTKINRNPSYSNVSKDQTLGRGGNTHGKLLENNNLYALKPHVLDFKFPEVESFMISNMGIIDGKLHIQTWRDKELEGHSINIYLKTSNGERISKDLHFGFGDVDEAGNPVRGNYPSYQESIYDIDLDRLDEYKLFGDFWTSKQLEGDWKVTFKAEDRGILKIEKRVDIGNMKIENISITPFGITLRGKGTLSDDDWDFDIDINTQKDIIKTSPSSARQNSEKFSTLYDIERPVDLDQIESITINGETISIKQ